MNIGQEIRTVNVEPVVDPVPDRDDPDRLAEVGPVAPRPTLRTGAETTPRRRRRVPAAATDA